MRIRSEIDSASRFFTFISPLPPPSLPVPADEETGPDVGADEASLRLSFDERGVVDDAGLKLGATVLK